MRQYGVYYDPITFKILYLGRRMQPDLEGASWRRVNVDAFPTDVKLSHLVFDPYTARPRYRSAAEIDAIEKAEANARWTARLDVENNLVVAVCAVLLRAINDTRQSVGLPDVPLSWVKNKIKEKVLQ